MAANAIDLCLAATVASDLGVSSSATIERLVTAVSRTIASYCRRTFEKGTVTAEKVPGYGRPVLQLARTPIVSISSIVELGATVSSSDYEVGDADAGHVTRIGGRWANTARMDGRITDSPGWQYPESGSNGIQATYVGGYVTPGQNSLDAVTYPTVTLPEDVQQAAVIFATQWYRSLGVDAMVQSESLGDWSVSYFAAKGDSGAVDAIPGVARSLLTPYVRWFF